jgi:predicted 2-oxoglutarate/Fe(II)-dependent dioxygenase YbiX
MIIIPKDRTILDFVQVYKKGISPNQCQTVLNKVDSLEWHDHAWSSYNKKAGSRSPDTEFKRAEVSNGMIRLLLSGCVNSCVEQYTRYIENIFSITIGFNGMTIPSINRYSTGQKMLPHVDHITSIFDGNLKGIPTLSVVGLLNNDFTDGQFMFWEDHDMKLEAGDIMIFPSNFMYKHHVEPVTQGTRYSFVSWTY